MAKPTFPLYAAGDKTKGTRKNKLSENMSYPWLPSQQENKYETDG